MIPVSPDDSRAGVPSAASLGGVPLELARGRHTATEAGPPRPACRGVVPGCVEPGTADPSPDRPPAGDGPAPCPEGSARSAAALPSAWQVLDDAPLSALRLRSPEPPDETG